MKKCYTFFILLLVLLIDSRTAFADHTTDAEITYQWLHDSTYRIYYAKYLDCSGFPPHDSLSLCYGNSCGAADTIVYMHLAAGSLPHGFINGREIVTSCSYHPTTCDGGTIPNAREWWYTYDVVLKGRCDHWKFSASSSHRNGAVKNIIVSIGPTYTTYDSMYVEATLDNLDAQGNSSVYFSQMVPYFLCENSPFTYNNGAIDIDNDSLYYEYIAPMAGDNCHGINEPYVPGYSLPANPIACAGTFVFNNSTGTESFTGDSTGLFAQLIRVNEYRKYQTTTGYVWKKIGSTMRENDIEMLDCNDSLPTLAIDSASIVNATYTFKTIGACTSAPFSFCFNVKSTKYHAELAVSDNDSLFTTSSHPSVSYTNMYTDSVRACLSWTPGPYDTGLHLLVVNAVDTSQCYGISVDMPVEHAVFAIPIYVWPSTRAFQDTIICPGDTVHLHAVGGTSFSWAALPGGSGAASLSCTACAAPFVHPALTTRYAIYAADNIKCANRDTISITTLPKPNDLRIDTALCTGSIRLSVPLTTVGSGITTTVRWSPPLYLSSTGIANPLYTAGVSSRYLVTITYAGKTRCKTVDTVNVKILKMFSLSMPDTTVCAGASIYIRASGDPDFNYTWSPANGVSNTNILNPVITADSTRIYTVTATHANCPDSSASFTLTVQPVPMVNAGNDTAICAGTRIVLAPLISPAYTYTYSWSPASAVHDAALSTAFIADTTTELSLTATTAAGCTGSDNVWIKVNPAPYFNLGKDTLVCHIGQIEIGNARQGVRYLWNTGDTTCCISVTANGTYTLIETDSISCSYTDSVGVYFSNCIHCMAVPNAFTPNNDGANDFFRPVVLCPIKEYHLKIFNRWGQEVFTSNDVNYGWDGKYNGQLMGGLVDNCVFVYVIELLEDNPGAKKTLLKGNITVIR